MHLGLYAIQITRASFEPAGRSSRTFDSGRGSTSLAVRRLKPWYRSATSVEFGCDHRVPTNDLFEWLEGRAALIDPVRECRTAGLYAAVHVNQRLPIEERIAAERLPAVHTRLRASQSRGALQWSQRYLQWSVFPRLLKKNMPSAISHAIRLAFYPHRRIHSAPNDSPSVCCEAAIYRGPRCGLDHCGSSPRSGANT